MTIVARKTTVLDIDAAGKTVLVRVDYNVPFHPGTAEISDDSRIRASLPTISYLLEQGSRVVLCSHLGRPRGRVVEELRMAPAAQRLSELLGAPVAQAPDCVGRETAAAVSALEPEQVLVLENLRFHPGRKATTRSSRRRWPHWRTCTSTTPSARRTGPTPPRKGSPGSCLRQRGS